MKRKLLLIGFLIWNLNSLFGQICGTIQPNNSTIYPIEDENIQAKGSSSSICINIYFHIIRNSNGTDAFTLPNLDNVVSNLNLFFSPVNITINKLGVDYINNTNYIDIGSSGESNTIKNINNKNNAINIYVSKNLWTTSSGAGIAGVVVGGLPNRNLFIRSNRLLTTTLAHELGHCLNLYHTHKGLAYNESGCQELINGSNCSSCGDYVCDTPADNGQINTGGYSPDLTNAMSYFHLYGYNRDHFTNGQGYRMRYAINFEPILQNIKSNSCTTISEISTICNPQTTTVTLSNIAGASTSWTSSNNVQIISSNNSSATIRGLNSYSNGFGWIRATLSNGITLQENFHVGKAEVNNVIFRNIGAGVTDYFCSSHINNEFEILPKIKNASYQIRIRDLSTFNIVAGPYNFNGNIATLPNSYNYTPGWYLFEVKSTNSCGTTNWTELEVEFVDCTLESGGGEMEYRIFPNPSSETLTIQKKSNLENSREIESSYSIELYDFNSNLIFKSILRNQKSINISKYKKGKYILKINKNNKTETHHIIIK